MIRTVLSILLLLFFNGHAAAENILLRTNEISSEIKIGVPSSQYKTHSINKNRIEITFKNPINADIDSKIQNEFIKSIVSENQKLIVETADNTKSHVSIDNGINIIVVKSKKLDDLSIGSEIEGPYIKKSKKIDKNPEAEKRLVELKQLVANEQYDAAITQINNFINKHKNSVYGQEAYFLLGKTYMRMGSISPKHYLQASSVFEDFAKKFTESYYYPDALWNAALSKEKAGLYSEAIFSYRSITQLLPDSNLALDALSKIASIYQKTGQPEKAIETYKEYLENSEKPNFNIKGKIGSLYAKLKDFDKAYEYFQQFLKEQFDYSKIDAETLFQMAKTLEHKNMEKKAIDIYNKIYNLYPNHDLASTAMHRAASIWEKQGNTQLADELYLQNKRNYNDTIGALKSTVRYAKKHLTERTTEQWKTFLSEALKTNKDLYLKAQAHYLITKSFYNEERYDNAIESITDFEKKFFDSPFLNKIYDIRQRIYLKQAENSFNNGNLNNAEQKLAQLLENFPDTKYYDEAQNLLENIEFLKTKRMLENGNVRDAISKAENYIAENERLYEKEKWFELLDEAYFNLISDLSGSNQTELVILNSKNYFNYVTDGKNAPKITNFFKSALSDKISSQASNEQFIGIINTYNNNKNHIDKWQNDQTKNSILSYVSYALYKIGENKKSVNILNKITKDTPQTQMMKILLNKDVENFNINSLNNSRFSFFIEELAGKNPLSAYDYAKNYTDNVTQSFKARYNILNTVKGNQRSILLNSLFKDVSSADEQVQKSIPEVYLKAGVAFFKEEDYTKALKALNKYISFDNIENEAKALYHLGKINLNKKNEKKAAEFFSQAVKNYPDNFYSDMANTELEDINWEKSLKNN